MCGFYVDNVFVFAIAVNFMRLCMLYQEKSFTLHKYKYMEMTSEQRLKIEERVVELLKTVYDPEIPVDVYNLGLVYKIDVGEAGDLHIDMTLTAPNCPAADFIVDDARIKLESIDGVTSVEINIVFEPEWNKDMMSDEAKLDLGFM
jgi:FeS assembly SUF system protein